MIQNNQPQQQQIKIYLYIAICAFLWNFFMSWIANGVALDAFSGDQQIYATIGQGILNGKEMYVDLWDHKGPLIFMIYALGYMITPDSKIGVFLVFYIFQFGTLLYSYKISSLFLSQKLALLTPIILPVFVYGSGFMFPSDIILCLQLITVYLFLTRKTPQASRLFLFGLFSWIAIFLKFNLATFWIPFLICETLELFSIKGITACIKGLACYLLSLLIIILFIMPFVSFPILWDSYFAFNLTYASDGTSVLVALPQSFLEGFMQPWYALVLAKDLSAPSILMIGLGILHFIVFTVLWPYKTVLKRTSICLISSAFITLFSVFAGSVCLFFYYVNLHPFYFLSTILVMKLLAEQLGKLELSLKWKTRIVKTTYVLVCTLFLVMSTFIAWRGHIRSENDLKVTNKYRNELNGEKDALLLGQTGLYTALNITPPIPHFFHPYISKDIFNKHEENIHDIIAHRGVKHVISHHPIDDNILKTLEAAGYKKETNTNMYHYVRDKDISL